MVSVGSVNKDIQKAQDMLKEITKTRKGICKAVIHIKN